MERNRAKTPSVRCGDDKVKVIELPWAEKGSRFTLLFEAFAIRVLKAARSVKDARELLCLSWFQTHEIMSAVVKRGLERRDAEEMPFVGMDEKSFLKTEALKATAKGYRNFEKFRTVILFYCGKLDMRPDFVRIGSAQ